MWGNAMVPSTAISAGATHPISTHFELSTPMIPTKINVYIIEVLVMERMTGRMSNPCISETHKLATMLSRWCLYMGSVVSVFARGSMFSL